MEYKDKDNVLSGGAHGSARRREKREQIRDNRYCVPPEAEVVVAGKDPLRRAIAQLLQSDGAFAAVHLYTPEPGALPMAAEGVLRILEQA